MRRVPRPPVRRGRPEEVDPAARTWRPPSCWCRHMTAQCSSLFHEEVGVMRSFSMCCGFALKQSRARVIFFTCDEGGRTLSRGACKTSTRSESANSFILSGLVAGSFCSSAPREPVAPWRRNSARDVPEAESDAWLGRHSPARACLPPCASSH